MTGAFRPRRFVPGLGARALRIGALVSTLTLSFLIVMLAGPAFRFFHGADVSLPEFLFGEVWHPEGGLRGGRAFFGATLRTAGLAVLFAAPTSLAMGLLISDYSSDAARRRYRLVLNVLSSIPAVVYGFFALVFVTPLLQSMFGIGRVQAYNTLSASIMLAVFITPYLTNQMISALFSTRTGIRRAAMALGATRTETLVLIVIPDAVPGILSAVVLGFSRAVGEAVIVGMAAGLGPAPGVNLFRSAETVTGFLLRTGSGGNDAVFAFGALLFLFTTALNILGDRIGRLKTVEELR